MTANSGVISKPARDFVRVTREQNVITTRSAHQLFFTKGKLRARWRPRMYKSTPEMARQNTFTVIPQVQHFNADNAAPARPMTSKQVRNAYRAASKTPTMTRAERLKWEREEQDRISREFEKEKAAAKARAARERKKEKEMQRREEKRRNGLPLVNVRPSQDTIARFVRGNGSKKKRDAEGLVMTAAREAPLESSADRDVTNVAILGVNPTALGSILEAEDNEEEKKTSQDILGNELARPNKEHDPAAYNIPAEPDQMTIHSKEAAIEKTETPFDVLSENHDVGVSRGEPIERATFDSALEVVPAGEARELFHANPRGHRTERSVEYRVERAAELMTSQDFLDEEINMDMLEEIDELLSGVKTPAEPQSVRLYPWASHTTANTSANVLQHKELQNIAGCGSEIVQQDKGKYPSQDRVDIQSSPYRARQAVPPAGTQAILINLDEFFPTSSQQLRELEEEQVDRQQKVTLQASALDVQAGTTANGNTQLRRDSSPVPIANVKLEMGALEPDFGSFPSTAHFSLSDFSLVAQPPRQIRRMHESASNASTQLGSVPEPAASPPSPQLRHSRFFTSSSSRDQMSLALQRSRRSAALEKIQEKERQRQEAGLLMQRSTCNDEARRQPASPVRSRNELDQHKTPPGSRVAAVHQADKENVQPEMQCSQETEYGGDWVENAAWDLALC
ncbi:hypothetical protein BBO_08620 [Beauveria brongniartii RCEF 3172]|uniref:Uncharacterized protein n=1 Tax=Beauveria brongniartii RCEF 3172 TaxID=1081107 RepID=A0A166XA76_9HYPO|nr:hypothetical protein BBO_08620 [Beauveria brongniartii RCEF 3172]